MGLSVQVTLSKVSVVGNATTNANGGGVSVSNADARLNIIDSRWAAASTRRARSR
jgi:hypothetical protein